VNEGSRSGETAAAGEVISAEVPALLAGVRLDRGVAMMANVSRARATDLIAAGRVQLDGQTATVGRRPLRVGETLAVALPRSDPDRMVAEPGVRFDVVYADEEIVVVDKPAGLVVHPGAGHNEGTLVGGLLASFPDLSALVSSGVCPADRPGIVQRLDKGTSGLLAVARTAQAYRALVRQLATRAMERRYLALVTGLVREDRGAVEAPIGRSNRQPTKMAVTARGKPARTQYRVLDRIDQRATLLEAALQSGRTHQIRVHMAAIGHPVVGDSRYGTGDRHLPSGRFFLHAAGLALDHPTTGMRLRFDSALPDDLRAYLDGLKKGEVGSPPSLRRPRGRR
jgi:23S rRNA pseudouridine1911/1915/1917 synthase